MNKFLYCLAAFFVSSIGDSAGINNVYIGLLCCRDSLELIFGE